MVFMAALAVSAMTVGKYSGGYAVGAESVPGKTHPDSSPRRDARDIN
jgi:hypothetical protein